MISEDMKAEIQDWISYRDAHPDNPRVAVWGMALLHKIAIELHLEDGN